MNWADPVRCDVRDCARQARSIVEVRHAQGFDATRLLCRSHMRTILEASGFWS